MKLNKLWAQHRIDMAVMLLCIGVLAALSEIVLGSAYSNVSTSARILRMFGVWTSLSILHIGAQAVMSQYQSRDRKSLATLYVLLASSVLAVAFVQLTLIALLEYGGLRSAPRGISQFSLLFALPYATGVLVLQSIRGMQLGLLAATGAALLFGWYAPSSGLITAMVLSSAVVACLIFRRGVRSRGTYLRGAAWLGITMLPFAVISMFLIPPDGVLDGMVRLLGCLMSGGLSALLAVAITPIIEYLGEYASDMRLIEMATLDHPLLKELSIQAPGTWNHSMVIGMMVESAAAAIGANPVVCRVERTFTTLGKQKSHCTLWKISLRERIGTTS